MCTPLEMSNLSSEESRLEDEEHCNDPHVAAKPLPCLTCRNRSCKGRKAQPQLDGTAKGTAPTNEPIE